MIESIMYFGIGFLVAALIGLVIIPLVHGRAVRLTMRRLEAATPLSMAEIQADKDQLRAEFAIAMRRLEMSVEQLRNKTAGQLAELGRKGDAVNRLKIELGEKIAEIFALEARDKALRDQVQAADEELAVKTTRLREMESAISQARAQIEKLMRETERGSSTSDAQKVEIAALGTQVEGLKAQLAQAAHDAKLVDDRRNAERSAFKATTQELHDERTKVANLGQRLSELDQKLGARTAEADLHGRRAHDLETRLTEQARLLTRSEAEISHLRAEIESAQRDESDLRATIKEITERAAAMTEALKSEKAQLQAELDRANEDQTRLSGRIADEKSEREKAAAAERAENALLRERISDVAAEVARLASTLEGPNSPIDAMIAAESARSHVNSNTASKGREPAEILNPHDADENLADRIRALQSASRVPQRRGPASRN
ncbi:MAG TPA: hypothetical protein VFX37_06455 [Pseudolabrys sp.]|nr:hypothetical protein [Pseudolabrys sp.]